MLISTNPTTGKQLKTYPAASKEEMHQSISKAKQAALSWSSLSFAQRGEHLKKLASILRENKNDLGKIMTDEMGKPVKEAPAEVEKAAWCCDHYAEHAERYLADELIESDAKKSFVCYQPLGIILGIMPWNAPFWVTFRYLAPALMAGNTCVLKHDPHTQGCANAIVSMAELAGIPSGVIANLPARNQDVAFAIAHPYVSAISFTGSANTGKLVASMAGAVLKPSVLELGGSDPFIVLQDADLEKAAQVAVLSRTINAGQSCIAAKRIIVEETVYDDFTEKVTEALTALKVGDPNDPKTDIGPIARANLRDRLHQQVTNTIKEGATCIMGGEIPEGDGFFYPVTLLTDVPEDSCAMTEELFGPVMIVTKVNNKTDALRLANKTEYGLAAGVWTADEATGLEFAQLLECGQVSVNGIVKTDPRLPSGGIKASGYGRELGKQGIHAFVNIKQVWLGSD